MLQEKVANAVELLEAFDSAERKWETEVWADSAGTWHAESSLRIRVVDAGYTFRGRSRSGDQEDAISVSQQEAVRAGMVFHEGLSEALRAAHEAADRPRD